MWVFFKNLSNLCKKNQFCWTCYTYFTGQCWKFWGRRQNSLPAIPALPAGTDVASWRDRLHSQPLLQLHGEQSPDVAKGGEGRCLAPKVLSPKVTSYLGWKRGYKLRACRLDLVKGCRNAFCLVFYNALRFEIFHIKIHFLIFFFFNNGMSVLNFKCCLAKIIWAECERLCQRCHHSLSDSCGQLHASAKISWALLESRGRSLQPFKTLSPIKLQDL